MAKTKEAQETPETLATPSPTMTISADALQTLLTKITEYDSKISAASGNDTAARKAFIEEITNANADEVNGMVTNLMEQLAALEGPVLVGLVTRLTDRFKTELEPQVNTWVDAEFPKQTPGDTADVPALKEARKALMDQFKALRTVLDTFSIPNEHIPDPKRTGGGRPAGSTNSGSSVKNGANKEKYRYVLDGKDRPGSQNTFSALAYYATDGCATDGSKRWGSKRLKEFLGENGIKFGEDDSWEVELPNKKKIGARRLTDSDLVEFGIDPNAAPEQKNGSTETPATETAPVAV